MRGTKSPIMRLRHLSAKAFIIPALVVFLAVDVILIALALGWGRDEPQAAGLASLPQVTVPVEADQDAAEELEPSTSRYADGGSRETVPRLLSVASETVAWRSEGGACHERGSLELTIDGGETWGAAYPSADGLGRPLWVSGFDQSAVQSAIASGTDCKLGGVRTFDSGSSWTQDSGVVTNSVLVHPKDPSAIVWNGEKMEGPCGYVAQVAVTSGVASAVCRDGSLWMVSNGSTDWSRIENEGVVSIDGSDGRWKAVVETSECGGLGLVGLNGASVQALACVPAGLVGAVTLNFTGDNLWLWVDDHVLVSTDGGRSFD